MLIRLLTLVMGLVGLSVSIAVAEEPPSPIAREWTMLMGQLRHVADALDLVLKERDLARSDLAACKAAAATVETPSGKR